MPEFIPFFRPDIGSEEIQEVVDTLQSGWLTTGPKARRFETKFAEWLGVRYAVAVNSGTAALHLALEALGVGPGDRVLTPDYTFTATAEVIRYLGADPVFADIDPHTLNIDPSEVKRLADADTGIKAVILVHFGGLACQMDRLQEICQDLGLYLLEDAAHAFPCSHNGQLAGSLGHAGAFSFYATKTLCTGEGGMLTTDSEQLANRAKIMRLHGISQDVFDRYSGQNPSWYYEVIAPGFKYNLPDPAAALGLQQLRRSREMQDRRQSIAEYYLREFKDQLLKLPSRAPAGEKHAWHLFVVQFHQNAPISRDAFIQEMAKQGIECSVHFIPLHRHPYWQQRYGLSPDQFPCSERVFQQAVSLPLYSALRDEEVEHVVRSVKEILGNSSA